MNIIHLWEQRRNFLTLSMLWAGLAVSLIWSVAAFSEEAVNPPVERLAPVAIEEALHVPERPMKVRRLANQLNRPSDRIYKLTMRSSVVYTLQTTVGYFTTIDLPEPALKVFAGDQDYFKVEINENQVLVKPVTDDPDAHTNLVVFTESGRLAFEITVGAPETADFVLDFRLPESDEALVQNAFEKRVRQAESGLEAEYDTKKKRLDDTAKSLAEKKLKDQVAELSRTIELRRSKTDGVTKLNLLSLSQIGAKGYLRFSVENHGRETVQPDRILLGVYRVQKRFFRRDLKEGVYEIPGEVELPKEILAGSSANGVVSFPYRPLAEREVPFIRIESVGAPRAIEITDFMWFQD